MVGSLTLLKLTFSLSIVKGSRRERWIGERAHMTAFPNCTSAQYFKSKMYECLSLDFIEPDSDTLTIAVTFAVISS